MKKLFIIVVLASFINFNYVFWYDYINSEKSINYLNNTSLMQSYIYRLKLQTNAFIWKYEINNQIINNNLVELENLLLILKNLDKKELSDDDYNKIINFILSKLKIYKDNIKFALKKEKDIYEKNYNKKKLLYEKIAQRLNIELNTIIKESYYVYQNKNNLDSQDNEIIKILKILNDENLKLKNFSKINFSSISEMTDSFWRILKNIKREMINFKKNR